jgi:hypothetical protein
MCRVSTNETNAAFIPYADENRFVSKMRRRLRRILGEAPNLRCIRGQLGGVRAVLAEGTRCTRCDPIAVRSECTP